MPTVQCIQCGDGYHVVPARVAITKFCSVSCRAAWRSANWNDEAHPRWLSNEPREKHCQHCGKLFGIVNNIAIFRKQKFCSKECGVAGQRRYEGEAHPLFKADSRRRKRPGKQASWSRKVIARDGGICQRCGVTGVEMHAHHIIPYAAGDARCWDLENGETLCYLCHWAEHTTDDKNGVNSGEPVAGNAAGNPEPSHGRKAVEGATARGRACRRWHGECTWCGIAISKRFSDAKGKEHLFCSKSCASSHRSIVLIPERKRQKAAMAVIASKSAPAHQYGHDIA